MFFPTSTFLTPHQRPCANHFVKIDTSTTRQRVNRECRSLARRACKVPVFKRCHAPAQRRGLWESSLPIPTALREENDCDQFKLRQTKRAPSQFPSNSPNLSTVLASLYGLATCRRFATYGFFHIRIHGLASVATSYHRVAVSELSN